MRIDFLKPTPLLVGVLCGLAVPSLVYGRLVMAVPLLAAVFTLALLPERGTYWRAMIEQARSPLGLFFLLTLVLWLPSMFFSPQPLRSFDAWARVPIFVGLVTLLWAVLSRDRAALSLALKVFIVANAVSVAFALSALTFLPEILSFTRMSGWSAMPYDGFRAQDIFNAYSGVGVLMVPALVWAGRYVGERWQLLTVASVIGLIAIVWLTNNLSAMAGLLAMLLVSGVLILIMRRNTTANVVVSTVLIVVTSALILWMHDTRGIFTTPAGTVAILPSWLIDYQRQTIWAKAIEIAMRSPWFGNGINVINLLPGADTRMPGNNLNVIPSHPHNWLVEVFAETGVFGILALIALVVTLCLKLAGDYLKSSDISLLAALLVNVGYWLMGLFNVSFWASWWQISYLVLTALCLAGSRSLIKN